MSTTSYARFVAVLFGLALPWGVTSSAVAADRTDADASAERVERDKSKRSDKLKPGELRRAEVVKHGWWWAAHEPPPDTGLLAAPQPPNPAPSGTLAVGAVGGDPERLAALEVRLSAKDGSTVKAFDMVLRESSEPGATVNAEAATILACPVTELFWADGTAAAWKDRPAYDCDTAGVEGKRNDAGLWRFDLTKIATAWLAEGSTASRSVVLVEGVEGPESFQVAFEGQKLEGIGLALKATPPVPVDLDTSGENTSGSDAGISSGSSGSSGSSSGAGSSSGGSLGGGSLGGGEVDVVGAPEPDMAAGDSGPSAGQEEKAVGLVPVAGPPAWYSGIPRTGLLLAPFALLLAYLVMLSLGPDGRPVPAVGRHGVSRALDRLRQVGRPTGLGR